MDNNNKGKELEQKSYLKEVTLYWRKFTRYSDDENWRNHEHCEFCWATFSESRPDDLHEGFTTEDEYHWICNKCFEDYKGRFQWKVVQNNNS